MPVFPSFHCKSIEKLVYYYGKILSNVTTNDCLHRRVNFPKIYSAFPPSVEGRVLNLILESTFSK